MQKYYLPHLTACACFLYLPQPAWIRATGVSYWHIRIPNQATRRYLLHIISGWSLIWWIFFFLLHCAIKSAIVSLLFILLGNSWLLVICIIWRQTSDFLNLVLFFSVSCYHLLSLGVSHSKPGNGRDNELWIRPPLLSTHTRGHSFQSPPPPFSSPPMSFNETPHGFVAFSLPLCFSLRILLSDLRNSLCIVSIDWGYKESGLGDRLSQFVKIGVAIASVSAVMVEFVCTHFRQSSQHWKRRRGGKEAQIFHSGDPNLL